jgi:hypothetical protein
MALAAVLLAALGVAAVLVMRRGPVAGAGPSPRRSLTQVTAAAGLEQWPAWFPDGARLVYSAETDGYLHLVERVLETGAERPLTSGPRDDIQAAVAPDGDQIAFVRSKLLGGRLQPSDVLGWYNDGGDIWCSARDRRGTRLVADAFRPAIRRMARDSRSTRVRGTAPHLGDRRRGATRSG